MASGTIDDTVNEIASSIKSLQERLNVGEAGSPKQLWISITGAPGSGKSTLCAELLKVIPRSVVVPMDGFHYYRAALDTFEDPVMAHRRRGAHWTFDAAKFVNSLRAAKASGSGSFPSFDHARGDPVEDDIHVSAADHDVVIVEGLYLLLPMAPWSDIKALMDLNVFLSCPEDLLVRRLTQRHSAAMGLAEEAARLKALDNDVPNSVEVIASGAAADLVVNSY